jgi:signal transduction histidine kinase/FixJ family two-component response regulator
MEATILVADDEPGVLRLCQRLLERGGSLVTAVTSSNLALEVLTRDRVDLLLADIRMPGLSGFQLMELARKHQTDISVVLMTGYGTIDMAIEALQRGADGLILKPFSGEELVRGVENALQEGLRRRDSQRLRVLRPLFDTVKTFFAETDPRTLQHLVLDAVCGHLPCNHAGLFIRYDGNRSLEMLEQRGGLMNLDVNSPVVTLVSETAEGGRPIWVNRDQAGGNHTRLRSSLNGQEFGSVLCVPMQHQDGMRVLLAARQSGELPFQESDLEMLTVLARQAAAAWENADLYEQLRSHMVQLEKSQRALVQVEKMVTAGRLTASIAHEINNPLQSLSNCMYLAGREDLAIGERQKYLKTAQDELERLMSTVQRMLDLYRPVARQRHWTSLPEVINRVLQLMEAQLKSSCIQLHTNYQSDLPEVLAVGSQIQQVIINLIINSLEAMPDGGDMWIDARLAGDGVEIIIEDDGPGIPESSRDLIFEPFVSTKEQGTGLGLSVSYGIMQAHGGTLELINGHSTGACFRIFLPLGGVK